MREFIARSSQLLGGRSIASAPDHIRPRLRKSILSLSLCLTGAASILLAATAQTQNAAANGDTRTLSFFHTHRRDSTTITFRKNGRYDEQALTQLNWFLRDWRTDQTTKMDPRLFDVLWEIYQESGSSEPIHIISSYRSPETNGSLRRRSSGVAKNSQHMLGRAMDIRLPDVPTERLRAIAMRMQYGGVGYYASSAFVHVDTGNVRAWPRMTREQLVRLFPDGKTLHLPSNGKPLPGYEQAKTEILARNAALASASAGGGPIGGLLANLFGKKDKTPPAPADTPISAAATMVASAGSDTLVGSIIPAPLPPQRPREIELASVLPPERLPDSPAVALPPPAPAVPRLEAVLGYDEKAAVKALFDPRAAFLDLGFAPGNESDLSLTHFTGPAVKALAVRRIRQADL